MTELGLDASQETRITVMQLKIERLEEKQDELRERLKVVEKWVIGAAAVLVGIVSHLGPGNLTGTDLLIHEIEIVLGVFIGSYTFTGSVIAFLKLRGSIGGKPFTLPMRHQLNLRLVLISLIFG